jgi:hypothetical protein
MATTPTREEAWKLLTEYVPSDNLQQKPTPSASGKTLVVASTRGNAVTDVLVDGKPVTIGLNAYIKP